MKREINSFEKEDMQGTLRVISIDPPCKKGVRLIYNDILIICG